MEFRPTWLLLAYAAMSGLAPMASADVGVEPDRDGVPVLDGESALQCPTEVQDGKYLLSWPGSDQKRERGTCHAGLAVRRWIAWYETGGRAWRAFFEAGQLDGRFESWYSNGQTRSLLTYMDGLLHGDAFLWWEDGTMRDKGRYEHGLLQGCHASWHPGGESAAKGAYHDGEKVGRWFYWDEQGNRSKECYGGAPCTGRCWWPMF